MSLSQATKEAIWIKRLLVELEHNDPTQATNIQSDSQGAIALSKNPIHHARTKHIDVRYHFI